MQVENTSTLPPLGLCDATLPMGLSEPALGQLSLTGFLLDRAAGTPAKEGAELPILGRVEALGRQSSARVGRPNTAQADTQGQGPLDPCSQPPQGPSTGPVLTSLTPDPWLL